jgi:endonuclease YncB( thermonuclease family)
MRQMLRLTFALVVLLLAPSTFAQTKELRGRVVGVSDGDTVTLLDSASKQHRVRCQGIDAPERAQDFGEAAKKRLSAMAFDREATVLYDKLDRYGRIVGKVMVGGLDVCGEMVFSGLAWHYKQYEGEQAAEDRKAFTEAEERARRLKLGLWSQASPTAPWEFRRSKRVEEATTAEPAREEATPAPVAPPAQSAATPSGGIVGNSNSRIYHWPGCPNYSQIAPTNRVTFESADEAEAAGFRAAKNCPGAAPGTGTTSSTRADTSASPSSSSGRVQVRGYYRKDGTYVRPHTRSAPRRRN